MYDVYISIETFMVRVVTATDFISLAPHRCVVEPTFVCEKVVQLACGTSNVLPMPGTSPCTKIVSLKSFSTTVKKLVIGAWTKKAKSRANNRDWRQEGHLVGNNCSNSISMGLFVDPCGWLLRNGGISISQTGERDCAHLNFQNWSRNVNEPTD